MFASIIQWVFANFGLALFIAALVISMIQWSTHHRISSYEIFFRWIVLMPLGCTAIYAFIMHAFYPDFTAQTIGWANSPFQFEVAMANLGFGVIAILSFWASYGFRLATVIGNACWLWGDAVGHIYQMYSQHNFTTGNAGSWFWMDLIVPLVLIICLSKLKTRYQ